MKNDMADKRLLQIAYLIFNCTRDFVDSLKKMEYKNLRRKNACQLQETYV